MVPAVFVFVDAIPLTPNGKINYKALPAPDWQATGSTRDFVPPRDEVEQQLAAIWQDLLSVEPISMFDDFFALGGHSLLAVRLFAQIEKQMERQLPITLLFQHPTVAQLADIMRQQASGQGWSLLAPIKPNGSRPPFFCVHGGAGHVFNYHKLAGYLDKDQPFYGVQPPDWTTHRVAVPDVVELAANYLAAIRQLQPVGPYYLGEFCFGGTIVFEMARRLQAAGEEVALLALIEPAAAISRDALWRSANGKGSPNKSQATNSVNEKPGSKWRQIKRHGFGIFFQARRHLVKSIRRIKRGVSALYLMTGAPVPRRLRDFYLIEFVTRLSRKAYSPAGPFEGDVHLTVIERGKMVDPTLGWHQYTTGEFTVCQVKTNHVGVLKEPHVQIVAQELQRRLDEAQGKHDAVVQ